MNGGIGKDNFNSIIIILDSKSISSTMLGKHILKLQKKKSKHILCSTQWGYLNNSFTSKVKTVLSDIDVTKIMAWNFHMDGLQGHHR